MDFVDEQYVALFEIGEKRGEIARFRNDGPGGRTKSDAEFARDDLRQRGLAEAGRADEQNMIERLATLARRLDENGEVFARLRLADEFRQQLRAHGGVAGIFVAALGRHDARRGVHSLPRRYLFGNSSPILTALGARPL